MESFPPLRHGLTTWETTPMEMVQRREASESAPASTSLSKIFHNTGLHKNQYISQPLIINILLNSSHSGNSRRFKAKLSALALLNAK